MSLFSFCFFTHWAHPVAFHPLFNYSRLCFYSAAIHMPLLFLTLCIYLFSWLITAGGWRSRLIATVCNSVEFACSSLVCVGFSPRYPGFLPQTWKKCTVMRLEPLFPRGVIACVCVCVCMLRWTGDVQGVLLPLVWSLLNNRKEIDELQANYPKTHKRSIVLQQPCYP